MDESPVWLLDIDGVLNAISPEPVRAAWPVDEWIRAEATCAGVSWPLLCARPVLDFVRAVHAAGRAEIRWHTTWQQEAASAARALDLPEFPVHPCPEFASYQQQRVGGFAPTGEQWWKLAAAERVIGEEDRPLLWTDDDIDPQLRGPTDHPLLRVPSALTISPRTGMGLTRRHLRLINLFLAASPTSVPLRPTPRPTSPPLPRDHEVTTSEIDAAAS